MEPNNTEINQSPLTIKEVLGKHPNLLVVHGIHAVHWTGENSLVNRSTGWQDKLEIALSFAPVLSTSTIAKGEDPSHIFSRMGLIVTNGNIEAMSGGDIASNATGLQKRIFDKQLEVRDTGLVVKRLAGNTSRMGLPYNELIVNSPKFGGFYLAIDRLDPKNSDGSAASAADIILETRKCGLPLFLMIRGSIYEVPISDNFDLDISGIRNSIHESGVVDESYFNKIGLKKKGAHELNDFSPDPKWISETRQVLLSNLVFDIVKLSENNEELRLILCSEYGMDTYMNFLEYRHNRKTIYWDNINRPELDKMIENGEQLLTIVLGRLKKVYYSCLDNKGDSLILKTVTNYTGLKKNPHTTYEFERHGVVSINLTGIGNIRLQTPLADPCLYPESLMNTVQKYLNDTDAKNNKLTLSAYYNLYGFAFVAQKMNDEETVKKVMEVIGQEKWQEISEIFGRKVDKSGSITLSDRDLE